LTWLKVKIRIIILAYTMVVGQKRNAVGEETSFYMSHLLTVCCRPSVVVVDWWLDSVIAVLGLMHFFVTVRNAD